MRFNLLVVVAVIGAMATGCQPKASTPISTTRKETEAAVVTPKVEGKKQEPVAAAVPPNVSVSPAAQPRTVHLGPDVTVQISADDPRVEVRCKACLDEGFLEQIACSPGTREHESLVVVAAKPSQIHAALLMAGFTPGSPGRWTYENNKLGTVEPTGDKIDVRARYTDRTGAIVEQPIRKWIRKAAGPGDDEAKGSQGFPDLPWVFGGSGFAPNRPTMNPPAGEHYVADMTGSIIGLVTFGDEVISFSRVLSDQEDVQPQEWEVNTDAVPAMGADVTLVLRRYQDTAK